MHVVCTTTGALYSSSTGSRVQTGDYRANGMVSFQLYASFPLLPRDVNCLRRISPVSYQIDHDSDSYHLQERSWQQRRTKSRIQTFEMPQSSTASVEVPARQAPMTADSVAQQKDVVMSQPVSGLTIPAASCLSDM
jgi:hypothetical protein